MIHQMSLCQQHFQRLLLYDLYSVLKTIKGHIVSDQSQRLRYILCSLPSENLFYTHPRSRNMPRTKSKTRYSEWKLYNINAQYSVLESSRLIFWKWKRLKVRVDGWVGAEPTVVDGDEWDDHRQLQLDNLGWNGGWWEKSQALQCQAIYTYVCLVNLFFPS